MISKVKHFAQTLKSAFWPLPSLLVFSCLIIAEAFIYLDSVFGDQFSGWALNVSPGGVRTLLSTAASGTLTLAALVSSTTLVALTLASSQFGPRLLHNFIRARINQITLGLLVGTFLFCLIVLRSTREESTPYLSALVAFLLTVGCLALFLVFVHHLVRSLQAETIVESVANELLNEIETFFPDLPSRESDEDEAEKQRESWDDLEGEVSAVSKDAGYLQFIDIPKLLELATREDCRVRAIARPGQIVLDGGCLFAYQRKEPLDEKLESQFLDCFITGGRRTPEQDFEFEIRQLVEVGIRALSPGINDPFTAINCIDFLTIALSRIAQRSLPRNVFYDESGVLRLKLRPMSFRNLLETAFLQIRHDGIGRPDICLSLFEALYLIGLQARHDEQLRAVIEFAELLGQEAMAESNSDYDKECFVKALAQVVELEGSDQANSS